MCRVLVAALGILAIAAPAASASERVHALDGSELSGWDLYFLQRTKLIERQPGLGPIHMDVSTRSGEAQFWFDQGLAQLFGFAHEDAIYSFGNAIRADENLAMAYWGIAYAYGANINLAADFRRARAAYQYSQLAMAKRHLASLREQRYIEAVSVRYDPDHIPLGPDDRSGLDREYFNRMKALRRDFPDDLHAATMAAEAGLDLAPWNQWGRDGKPGPETLEVIGYLEQVLARDPHHVGAQHYLVHAVEASPDPDRARPAAERMMVDAPGQPHLVHASSHIFARDGDWDAGVRSGAAAEQQDRIYLNQNGTNNLYTLAHGSHNIHFQASVASMGGRSQLAFANAEALRLRVEPYLEELRGLEFYQPYEILMRTRFGDWGDVLDMREPRAFLLGARGLRHYARGVAFAKTRRLDDASRELARLIGLRNSIASRGHGPAEYPEFNLNHVDDVLDVGIRVLAGRIRWYRGNRDLAIRLLRDAVAREDKLHYDEPPPWYFPAGESLGAALLLDGRPREAEAAFRAVLKDYPGDGWALFGLIQALTRQGAPPSVVNRVRAEFAQAWRGADVRLTIDDLL